MDFHGVVEWIAVFSTGMIAGILFGDRAGNTYARRRLTTDAFGAFQREQNRRFAKMMPLPILAGVVSSSAWLVLQRDRAGMPDYWLIAAGTTSLILFTAITRMVHIPINNRLNAAKSSAAETEAVRRLWQRWEKVHTVRTAFAVLAFACELAALLVQTL